MKKGLLTLTALAFVSATALAGGLEVPVSAPTYFCGLYAGIGLGVGLGSFNTASDTPVFFTSTSTRNQPGELVADLFYRNSVNTVFFDGEAYLGYGWTWDRFNLALQGFLRAGSQPKATSSSFLNSNVKGETVLVTNSTQTRLSSFSGGLDGLPGFLLTPTTLLQGLIGVDFNRITMNSTSTFSINIPEVVVIPPIVASVPLFYNVSKNVAGLRLGAGLKQMFNNNWAVSALYVFTTYGTITGGGSNSVTVPLGTEVTGTFNLVNSTRVSVQTNVFLLNLEYYFGNIF